MLVSGDTEFNPQRAGRAGQGTRAIQKGEPGVVRILRQRQRRSSATGAAAGWSVTLGVLADLSVDLDARKLVGVVTVALAEHFERSLLGGQKADGSGPVIRYSESTVALAKREGRTLSTFGVESEWMARHWMLGKVRGHMLDASRQIKPNGSDGRAARINEWLRPRPRSGDGEEPRPAFDMQSVSGAAAEVIRSSVQSYMDGIAGARLGTPASADTRARLLHG